MKSSKILRNLGLALALVSSVAIMSQQVRADGITWTARNATEASFWSSVTFGNGTFVAVSTSGTDRVMTSTDGITWTARNVPASRWTSVTYGNGVFVAVAGFGTDRIMTSPDGVTWTPRGSSTDSWDAIAYGNNTFVAVGMSTNRVMTSTDGITWTNRTVPTGIQQWKSVTWGNNKFVAVSGTGSNDRVMTSADGVTWTYAQAIHNGNWSSIAYGNNTFVATATSFGGGGSMDYVMTSSDGITWTARTAAAAVGWNAVVYGGGKFVAVSSSGSNRVMTSTDGITWAAHTAADASGWTSVTYGNGLYVAIAVNGSGSRVMTSGAIVAPTTTAAPTTTTVAPTTTTVAPTTTTVAPTTTTTVPARTESVPGVTVTDTKIYSRPPARVASSSAIAVLTREQNKTLDITTRTPTVCLPNDDELVFIDTGRCIADVVNTKTRQVLRSLRTTVMPSDVSELNVGNEIVTLAPIFFENGSSIVSAKGRATLRNLKERISAAGSVLVIGHSGTLNGNTPENIALSRSRAVATVATLQDLKAKGPFAIAGVGAVDPAGTGRTEASQALNRRVVVVLIP